MQEAIIELGDIVLKEGGGVLDNLVQELEPKKKDKQLYICKFMFNTKENKLEIDTKEEMNRDSASKYLFIGSLPGTASDQWYVTSTSYIYHLTEAFPSLQKIDLGQELNDSIKNIVENFYVDLGEIFKRNKNRYVLDFSKFSMGDNPKEILENLIKENNVEEKELEKKLKEPLKKSFMKIFEEYLKNQKDISKNEIGIYTIFLDGKPLCDFNKYREVVIENRSKTKKNKKEKKDLSCSICGSKSEVTGEISSDIKFYTTNQLIFANNVNKQNYEKNMILCQECISKLNVGEKYIKNNLSSYLSGFTLYLIPHFIYGEKLNKEELDDISRKLKKSLNTVTNYDDIVEFQHNIQNELDYKEELQHSFFMINLIFYKSMQKATKVQRFIKDISPGIFKEIGEAIYKTQKSYLGNYRRKLSLKTLYYLVPIRQKSSEALEYRNLLNIYDAIFTKRVLIKSHIISNILKCVKVQFFGKAAFNVSKGTIENTIADGNLFIKFLEYLGCLEREENAMETDKLLVKDHIKSYIKEMNYGEEQTALFLLGYLVGEVGRSQKRVSEEGKKPILNKLNFGGMDKNKVIRLSNEVFNKLKQEKILKYNEAILADTKMLLDKNLNTWTLNKQENLFYILSGYSYATKRIYENKENGGEENEE
ncbi:TIGR02556 family CRISPR-associated protein [Hathewaya histolytica]|uniref:TIGR02556 family CRISPR-associated protein n=1 Tax=Hathewaya histolytica TaxID=1498 RepID=UPI003B675BCF